MKCGARRTLIRPRNCAIAYGCSYLILLRFKSEPKGKKKTPCIRFRHTSIRFHPPPREGSDNKNKF
jgi:hypothetical protein